MHTCGSQQKWVSGRGGRPDTVLDFLVVQNNRIYVARTQGRTHGGGGEGPVPIWTLKH